MTLMVAPLNENTKKCRNNVFLAANKPNEGWGQGGAILIVK